MRSAIVCQEILVSASQAHLYVSNGKYLTLLGGVLGDLLCMGIRKMNCHTV